MKTRFEGETNELIPRGDHLVAVVVSLGLDSTGFARSLLLHVHNDGVSATILATERRNRTGVELETLASWSPNVKGSPSC